MKHEILVVSLPVMLDYWQPGGSPESPDSPEAFSPADSAPALAAPLLKWRTEDAEEVAPKIVWGVQRAGRSPNPGVGVRDFQDSSSSKEAGGDSPFALPEEVSLPYW